LYKLNLRPPKNERGEIFRSDVKDIAGEIEWDLGDCVTGELSESGKRPIAAEEVVVEWRYNVLATGSFEL